MKILQHKIDIPTRTEIALRNRNKLNTCHNLVDEIRANLRRIDTFRRRSFVQEEAHELVLSSLVPFIYGSLAASHEIEIKKRNGWKKITSGVIMDAPRRAGKSNLAAMMFACLLTSLPNVEIVVISNSANAAGSEMGILGQTRYFFSNLNPHQNLKHDNNKHVTYVVNSNDIRKLHSFSADAGDR